MLKKYWTKAQIHLVIELVQKNLIPQEVADEIMRVAGILDEYYGAERNPKTDDGGIICLILPANNKECKEIYHSLLDEYYMKADEAEFHDMICQNASGEWFSDLFLVNNEFSLTIIYLHGKEA